MRGRRSASANRPQSDEVDLAAALAFDRRYNTPRLRSVVLVIAAYNEEGGIRDVLDNLPHTICDLPADVLVVDDGSSDDTAARVDEAGRAYLVSCSTNRGQGAALRLGYRIAGAHGARYLITTDADGQYDATDLPVVLAPILSGEADFVTGSRLLGKQQTRDRVRRLGVHVFAWLVSALVGRRLTDTSFGLRAMRTEVTEAVTLNQPQYQSSELLIGAVSHGFKVLEVPGTMHVRGAGASKKGGNLIYGRSYARVVLTTWWREGCPAPVAERAPALRGSGATTSR
jgi:glycosyltransferase involved in cell wall biosynthesis